MCQLPESRIFFITGERSPPILPSGWGVFFGVSDRYFLDMQNDIEVRELTEKLDGDITTIKPYTAAAI